MKLYRIQREHKLEVPVEKVFAFFSKPANLQKLTPPSMKMRVLTPDPINMHAGAIIDYVVGVGGLPMRWTAYIQDFKPPVRFVDIQLRGPYAYWHHTHSFEDRGDYTLISDDVVYAMPFGPFGTLAHALFVKRQLAFIFRYRAKYLEADVEW
jgi:ligand-binding SRPBCC domain-containing protein